MGLVIGRAIESDPLLPDNPGLVWACRLQKLQDAALNSPQTLFQSSVSGVSGFAGSVCMSSMSSPRLLCERRQRYYRVGENLPNE